MSSQYENLPKPGDYADFFKVEPAIAPTERLVRPARTSGFVRAKPVQAVVEIAAAPATSELLAPQATPAPVHAEVVVSAETAPTAAPVPLAAETGAARKKQVPPVEREWVSAQWGLVPHWVKSASDARLRAPKLQIARNETASTAQAFRDAWLAGQRCIVPMMAFFEDDYRTGKRIPTRISRVDGMPMGVAGLWSSWKDPETGEELISYAILTINANSHALMHRYQHQGSEKRMPAVLGEGAYDAWLSARQDKAREFMRAYPANWLTANPVERKEDKKPKGWLD